MLNRCSRNSWMHNKNIRSVSGVLFVLVATLAPAQAQQRPDSGKLLATGGVSQLEGAGGGGLTPWALIAGYGTRDSYGANVHATAIRTQDHALYTQGFA